MAPKLPIPVYPGDDAPQWRKQAVEFVQLYLPTISAWMTFASQNPLVSPIATTAGLFAILAITHANKRRMQRLVSWSQRLDEKVAGLDLTMLKMEIIQSQEYEDLLYRMLESVVEARDEARLEWYGNLLLGVATQTCDEDTPCEEYIQLLKSLTPNQVTVLSKIWELQKHMTLRQRARREKALREPWTHANIRSHIPHHLEPALDLILTKLEAEGLIVVSFRQKAHYPVGVPVMTPMMRQMMCGLEGVSYEPDPDEQLAEHTMFAVVYRLACQQGFLPIDFRHELLPLVKKAGLSDDEILSSLLVLAKSHRLEMEYQNGGSILSLNFRVIAGVKPNLKGFFIYGSLLHERWDDLESELAHLIIQEDIRLPSEIALRLNIQVGLVHALLKDMETKSYIQTGYGSNGLEILHVGPGIHNAVA